jgi:hypothetical protein
MEICQHEFTIIAFNLGHHEQLTGGGRDPDRQYRTGTGFIIESDLDLGRCPHRQTIPMGSLRRPATLEFEGKPLTAAPEIGYP